MRGVPEGYTGKTCDKCGKFFMVKKETGDKLFCPYCGQVMDIVTPYYCAYCNVYSNKPHDHSEDTVEPLERPRHDY